MKFLLTSRIVLLGIAALSTMLSGCANKADPSNVDRRAVERWNFLIGKEAEKAYDYLTPGYRATKTREEYAAAMNNRPVGWKKAEFKEKKCDAERCVAQVAVTFEVMMPGVGMQESALPSIQTETWLLVDGEWFVLPSQ